MYIFLTDSSHSDNIRALIDGIVEFLNGIIALPHKMDTTLVKFVQSQLTLWACPSNNQRNYSPALIRFALNLQFHRLSIA